MKRIENHCCDCAVPGYPCKGSRCPNVNVEVYYCDKCGDALDVIYEVDCEDLCLDCLKEMFRKEL